MKFILSLALAIAPFAAFAENFSAYFPVVAATVHPQGAQVTLAAEIDLPPGRHTIRLAADPSLLQSGQARFQINSGASLGISLTRGLPDDPALFYTQNQLDWVDRIRDQETLIEKIAQDLRVLNGQLDALSVQNEFLRSLKHPTDKSFTVEEFQAFAVFLPETLKANASEQSAIRLQIRDLKAEQDRERQILTTMEQAFAKTAPAREDWLLVTAQVDAGAGGAVEILADGFANNAGWQMEYEVFLDEEAETIRFDRQAVVTHQTASIWRDVDLTLSTARPFQRIQPNVPGKDVVVLAIPAAASKMGNSFNGSRVAADLSITQESLVAAPIMEPAAMAPVPSMGNFDGVAVEYKIDHPVTLSGLDRSGQQIELASISQKVDISRYASPRRDQEGFVRVMFDNSMAQPLVSGHSLVYRNDNLVGRGYVSFVAAGGKAKMHFGPDHSLPLEIRFLSELEGDVGFISRSNTREEQLEFEVSNLKDTAQDVTVAYALPVSENEDIAVRVRTSVPATRKDVDGRKGVNEWDFTLAPGEKRIVRVDVTLTWPEDAVIVWQP